MLKISGEALKLMTAEKLLSATRLPKDVNVDVAIYHGRGHGDQGDLHELMASMYHNRQVRQIALTTTMGERFGGNGDAYEAGPGIGFNITELVKLGVLPQAIIYPDRMIPAHHTRGETDEFLRLAMQQGWRSAVLPAHPHQLLRIAGGWVKAIQEKNYWMELYLVHPKDTDWEAVARTNQGLVEETRGDNIPGEFGRYPIFLAKGDLATPQELLDYLKNRARYSAFCRGSDRLISNLPPETGRPPIQA